MENLITIITDPIISIIAIVQLSIFIRTLYKLGKFRFYFPKEQKWSIEENNAHYSIIVKNSSSEFKKLVSEINEYLEKNEGTTDYGIIKDKVQSRLDAIYEYATSKIAFPTYLGLFGTFLGVCMGLYKFKSGVGGQEVVSDITISQLIDGIIISMATSLFGLIFMILGNAIASRVLKNVETEKNKFFDFIQVNLIPVMGTSMVSALNKLHKTINTFEPAFKKVIGEFKDAFNECTVTLRDSFGDKVKLLTDAVETMGNNMSLINENVKMQDQLLKTIKQKETLNTLESFTKAANKFESATTSINQLSDVKEKITESTTQLIAAQTHFIEQLVIPKKVFEKINAILKRIVTFEESINGLGENIAQTQLLGNSQMNLIQEQITAIQKKTGLAVSYQELADEELKNVYIVQTKAIKELNEKYCTAIDNHGDDFKSAMNEFKASYEKIVKECISAVDAKREEFLAEIQNSLNLEAKNQHLANLDKIPEIVSLLSSIQKKEIKLTPSSNFSFSSSSNTSTNIPKALEQVPFRPSPYSTNKSFPPRTEEITHHKQEITHNKEEEIHNKKEITNEKKSWFKSWLGLNKKDKKDEAKE